jgi:hypothetical protein
VSFEALRRPLTWCSWLGVFAYALSCSRVGAAQTSRKAVDTGPADDEMVSKPSGGQRARPGYMGAASIGVDVGMPFGSAQELRYSIPTLGINAELLAGTPVITAGGFLRWGIGALDKEPRTRNGLLRSGPRLRLSTPVLGKYPSIFVSAAAGWGVAYAEELDRYDSDADQDREERLSGVAYWQLFAAPGAGVLFPLGVRDRPEQVWHLTASANYYFTYWLQQPAREQPLATRWLEIVLGVGVAWLP